MTKKEQKVRVEAAVAKAKGDLSADVSRLFNDGVLVDLKIGMYTGLQRNTAEDIGVDMSDVPKYVVGLGTKRLIPHALAHSWTNLASHARYILRKYSFMFPISETNFVPLKALPMVLDELEKTKEEFEKAWRKGLINNFDKVREDFLKEFPEHRRKLEQVFPSRSEVESRFYFEVAAFTVSLPKKLAMSTTTKGSAEDRLRAEQEAIAKYQRELDRRVNEFLNESVKTLRAKTVNICATVIESIKSGKSVTNKSITMLMGFIERFKSLNFIGDVEVESRLDRLKKEVLDGHTAEDFAEVDRMRDTLAEACNDVIKAAGDVSDLSRITGGYRRRVVVD
jgi:hypothetical protein